MATKLYTLAKQKLLGADLDLTAGGLKLVLVASADYALNLATDEFLADIPAPAQVATSPELTGVSIAGGVLDADDPTFSAVTGAECDAYVLFQDSGAAATSPLIAYIDNATGLPITPNGADINLEFDSGPNKIFALV